jgi:mannose-6-phosphate isomerase
VSRRVPKPWGEEEIFAETDRYVGKILTVLAGHSLSLQYHRVKDETMRVLDGRCEMTLGQLGVPDERETRVLGPGDTVHIAPGLVHRLLALTDVRIVEVSTADLDDVVRLEDRYGRAGTIAP